MSGDEPEGVARMGGGRRNAIVTYERVDQLAAAVSDVQVEVVRSNGKLDAIGEKLTEMATTKYDHEVRIRALELSNAGVLAANAKGSSVWNWVFGALIAVPTLLLSLATYLAGH